MKRPEMNSTVVRKSVLKTILRLLVPERVLKEREVFRRLGPRCGKIYLKLRCLDCLGIRGPNRRQVPVGARSFVFVCHGNIMRSPMAELAFRSASSARGQNRITVKSAGIHATPGTEAHPYAQIAAQELGFSLGGHHSQVLTPEKVREADAILAMDFRNKAELLALFPDAANKIFMLSAYAEGPERYREISDPFLGDQDDVRRCYHILQACIDNLAASLWPGPTRGAEQVTLECNAGGRSAGM